jgi:hypothetical protein
MKHAGERGSAIKVVRDLARFYGAAALNRCLAAQLEMQTNGCVVCADNARSVDLLARAAYVKNRVEEKGATVNEAIRELGRKMRGVQQVKG